MADIKWIKITTDMFDNRKIKYLRRLPDGDSIVLIWVMLLTMAGRCNAGGMIFLAENIPYTPKMLADELDFDESVVELALQALLRLGMVTAYGETLCITNWEEYQNIDKMTEIREYNRLAKQKQRAKQKALLDVNDKSMTSQSCQDTDIDKDIDKDIEISSSPLPPSSLRPQGNDDDDFVSVIRLWEKAAGRLVSPLQGEELQALLEEHTAESVCNAIRSASQHNAVNLAYIKAVLNGKPKQQASGKKEYSPEMQRWLRGEGV